MDLAHTLTLGDIAREHRRSRPELIAIVDGSTRLTYEQARYPDQSGRGRARRSRRPRGRPGTVAWPDVVSGAGTAHRLRQGRRDPVPGQLATVRRGTAVRAQRSAAEGRGTGSRYSRPPPSCAPTERASGGCRPTGPSMTNGWRHSQRWTMSGMSSRNRPCWLCRPRRSQAALTRPSCPTAPSPRTAWRSAGFGRSSPGSPT